MKRKDPEYTLNVFHRTDESTGNRFVVFLVQTTKVFVSFRYEILLEEEFKGKTLHLRIVGLHAPSLLMPSSGPARGSREFDSLSGDYTVIVTKQDRTTNQCSVHITDSTITCSTKEVSPFILISNDPVPLD